MIQTPEPVLKREAALLLTAAAAALHLMSFLQPHRTDDHHHLPEFHISAISFNVTFD